MKNSLFNLRALIIKKINTGVENWIFFVFFILVFLLFWMFFNLFKHVSVAHSRPQ